MKRVRLANRLSLKKGIAYKPVANVTAFRIVVSARIRHSVGDLFHIKDGFVELSHAIIVFGANGDMLNARKH